MAQPDNTKVCESAVVKWRINIDVGDQKALHPVSFETTTSGPGLGTRGPVSRRRQLDEEDDEKDERNFQAYLKYHGATLLTDIADQRGLRQCITLLEAANNDGDKDAIQIINLVCHFGCKGLRNYKWQKYTSE